MTMDDDRANFVRLSFKDRQALAAALPWVAYDHTASEQCEAVKGKAPLKAYWDPKTNLRVPDGDPIRRKYQCRFAARWVFIDLYGGLHRFCWVHLLYRGFYRSMEEEARLKAWDDAHPVDTVLGTA